MRLTTTLLLVLGCATARTDERPTTPEACLDCTHPEGEPDELDRVLARQPETPEAAEAQHLAAELEASFANPPPAVPEPTPPEPLWTGYMVVHAGSVPPSVAILFPEDDGLITQQTLDEGVSLHTAVASSSDGYWRFPVTRGGLLFYAVRVYDDGRVTVEMPIPTQYGYAIIVVATHTLNAPDDMTAYRPCAHNVCGRLQKAVANRIVGCEGLGCADLGQPTP